MAVKGVTVGVEHEFFGAVAEVGDELSVVGGDDYVILGGVGIVTPVLGASPSHGIAEEAYVDEVFSGCQVVEVEGYVGVELVLHFAPCDPIVPRVVVNDGTLQGLVRGPTRVGPDCVEVRWGFDEDGLGGSWDWGRRRIWPGVGVFGGYVGGCYCDLVAHEGSVHWAAFHAAVVVEVADEQREACGKELDADGAPLYDSVAHVEGVTGVRFVSPVHRAAVG